jgi:hypothetical protein
MKMEIAVSYETFVNICLISRCYIPEGIFIVSCYNISNLSYIFAFILMIKNPLMLVTKEEKWKGKE